MIFLRALIVSLILSLPLACSETFYESYSRSHPAWKPRPFPLRNIDLHDTIASLLAPREYGDHTFVSRIRVFRVSEPEWTELDYDSVTSSSFQPSPTDHYLVMALLTCQHSVYDYYYGNDGVAWYLVLDRELLAYHHLQFQYRCESYGDRKTHRPFPESYLDCVDRIAGLAERKREVASLAKCGAPPAKEPVPE